MLDRQKYTAEPLVLEPSALEVELAIEKLKSHKSPGTDQIPAELIKARGSTIRCAIHKLIISIWHSYPQTTSSVISIQHRTATSKQTPLPKRDYACLHLPPQLNFLISFTSYPLTYEDGTDSVPKRWLLNTTCRGTTQKITRNITFFLKVVLFMR
jgi:hypothetical protein